MNLIAVFWVWIAVFVGLGCSSLPEVDSTPGKDLKPVVGEQKKTIAQVKRQIKSGKAEENIAILIQERNSYKGSELEPEIEQLLGQEYLKAGKHTEAGLSYLRAAQSSIGDDRKVKLCQLGGKAFISGRDWEHLKKGVEYCIVKFELSQPAVRELKALKLQGMESEGVGTVELAKAYVDLAALSRGEVESQYRTKALQCLDTMDRGQLESVVGDSDFGFLRGHAAFRLGQQWAAQRETSEAKTAFNKVIQFLPETELAEISQKKIEQMEAANSVNTSTVGVVLPLSGRHASLGQKVLRGLQLGLGLADGVENPIRLAIVDSEGNADLARKAVERLVQEDNVIAVVGELLSKTASSVADQAQVFNVPNLALSQKSRLTDLGENIFRFGMTSENQIRYLVKKCIVELGMRRFAIVYPNDKFGVEYANLFWDEVLAHGGEIRAAQSYEPDENDFSGLVQRLAGTYYLEERQEEIRWTAKQRAEKQKGVVAGPRSKSGDDALAPVIDFDGIFIADGIKALGQISGMLAFNGVRGTKVLGPNIWNSDAVIKRVVNSGNQTIFVDGAGMDIKSPIIQTFITKYKGVFSGVEPGAFEIQGYETGLLLSKVLSSNVRSREEFRQKLLSLPPIQGVTGMISLKGEREFTKPLYLYTVENNQIKILTNE